jgi:chromosome partitioning protein
MRLGIASAKGGSGKTSTCGLLALALHESGRCVRLTDNDPQAALFQWMERLDLPFKKESATAGILGKGTPSLEIADHAPGDPETLAPALQGFDLILCPTQPSPLDVAAAVALAKALKEPERLRILWNATDGTALSRAENLAAMLEPHKLTACKSQIPRRAGIRYATLEGFSVLDEATKTAVLALALEIIV